MTAGCVPGYELVVFFHQFDQPADYPIYLVVFDDAVSGIV